MDDEEKLREAASYVIKYLIEKDVNLNTKILIDRESIKILIEDQKYITDIVIGG